MSIDVNTYNSKREVLGKKLLSEAQQYGDWHKIVSVFIVDSENHLLIERRRKAKEGVQVWDVVTGYIEADESSIVAAKRAALKDLSLYAPEETLELIGTVSRGKEEGNIHNQLNDVYLLRLKEFPEIELNLEKIAGARALLIDNVFSPQEQMVPRTEAFEKVMAYLEVEEVL